MIQKPENIHIIITYGNTSVTYVNVGGDITLTASKDGGVPHGNIDFNYKYALTRSGGILNIASIIPEKIIKNPTKGATTVKWEDGTYTTVKRSPDDPEDDYAAFTAALAINLYGSNSAVKRMIAKKTETLNKKKKEKKDERSEQN